MCDVPEGDRPVKLTVAAPIATVTLNSPPLNLLTHRAKIDLAKVFASMSQLSEVRVVLLRGEGERSFSAGADLGEFFDRIENDSAYDAALVGQVALKAVRFCAVPVVAVIDGYAFGAGLELALAADLRIASDRALFAFPEVTRGVFPGNGGALLATQLLGAAAAKEMMLLGRRVTADRAYALGLVNQVMPPDQLDQAAEDLAQELAARPVLAVAAIRKIVDELALMPAEQAWQDQAHLFAEVFRSPAVHEGVTAFHEDRQPDFHPTTGNG